MTDKTQSWTRKDLLGLRELSAEEIHFVLETADAFKQVCGKASAERPRRPTMSDREATLGDLG